MISDDIVIGSTYISSLHNMMSWRISDNGHADHRNIHTAVYMIVMIMDTVPVCELASASPRFLLWTPSSAHLRHPQTDVCAIHDGCQRPHAVTMNKLCVPCPPN